MGAMDDNPVKAGLRFFLFMLPILFWPVVLLGTVAAIIELVDRKRFSLRAMLIAMTVTAVLLGAIAYALN